MLPWYGLNSALGHIGHSIPGLLYQSLDPHNCVSKIKIVCLQDNHPLKQIHLSWQFQAPLCGSTGWQAFQGNMWSSHPETIGNLYDSVW